MLNYIWGLMIIIGIVFGAFNGTLANMADQMLDSGKEAVALCITMMGIMSIWTGLMEVAKESGMIEGAAKKLDPFICFLFPKLPERHEAREHITTNIIANILGLGWAATPAGLRAMKSLGDLNHNSHIASNEMCSFLVLNISSLQLIPVNIIAYRSQYGSVDPTAIIMPALIATIFSTVVGVIFIKCMAVRK
ncbi:MAG: nucleoside recognition protein [bacterium]|nr:nucleoside recognition protein [bacterium]